MRDNNDDCQAREIQQRSVETSRRALARLNEAGDIAQQNLARLNSQGEMLTSTQHTLETARGTAKVNATKVDALKSLSRFFMIPAFGVKKSERAEERFVEEQRMKAQQQKNSQYDGGFAERSHSSQQSSRSRGGGAAKHYSTPLGVDRDENEREIDGNLNHISSGLSRLKMMSNAMSEEIDKQNVQIDDVYERTEGTHAHVHRLNQKLGRFGGRQK